MSVVLFSHTCSCSSCPYDERVALLLLEPTPIPSLDHLAYLCYCLYCCRPETTSPSQQSSACRSPLWCSRDIAAPAPGEPNVRENHPTWSKTSCGKTQSRSHTAQHEYQPASTHNSNKGQEVERHRPPRSNPPSDDKQRRSAPRLCVPLHRYVYDRYHSGKLRVPLPAISACRILVFFTAPTNWLLIVCDTI